MLTNRICTTKYCLSHSFRRPLQSLLHNKLMSRHASTFIERPSRGERRVKSKEQLAREKFEEQLNSPSRFIRWGAIARSDSFKRGLTKYLIAAYVIFLMFGWNHMKKLHVKEQEMEALKRKEDAGQANGYEKLRLKAFVSKMRTRDELKLQRYEQMKEEGVENFENVELNDDDFDSAKINNFILPARDTTEFYDEKASNYDSGVDMEERVIMMGRKRKWLMKHCKGDVLEVACGTGRNIKYLDESNINSITYLDSSEKMIEITKEKFKKFRPDYKKVAFVHGKAEDLVELATTNGAEPVKYDTIIEAFGLCSHEDPLKSLQNFKKLLKPNGRVILLEHGRCDHPFINKYLDQRAEHRLKTWGCRWNLDLGELLDDSGLDVIEENTTHFGTTWMIVAKRPEDGKTKEEIGFMEKYVHSGLKSKLESMKENDEGNKDL